MDRRRFIRLTGLTSFAFLAGSSLMAAVFNRKSASVIPIGAPSVHVRHGNFNLQMEKPSGLHIQRDIFNKNGLPNIAEDRMVSVRISEQEKETFGVCDSTGFQSESKNLTCISLKANTPSKIDLESSSIVFAEFEEVLIDGASIKSNEAFTPGDSQIHTLISAVDQSVFVYKNFMG